MTEESNPTVEVLDGITADRVRERFGIVDGPAVRESHADGAVPGAAPAPPGFVAEYVHGDTSRRAPERAGAD